MFITPDRLIGDLEAITFTGRSLQKEIGVSEIGMTCRRCVARKLSLMEKAPVVGSWRTTIGRATHDFLDQYLGTVYSEEDLIRERKLHIHDYKDLSLAGSCDVFAPNDGFGMVLDWKVVGDATLADVRSRWLNGKRVKDQYFIQAQTYAYGWEQLGYNVASTVIMYLPANSGDVRRDHVAMIYPYDRSVALAAIAEIELLIDRAEAVGWEQTIREQNAERGCLSCPSYAGADNPILDLLPKEKREKWKQEHGIR